MTGLDADYVKGTRPAVADGTVYTAGGNGILWAVDAATGRKRWRRRLRPRWPRTYEHFTTPAVADGRVYVCHPRDSLWVVDAATGTTLWDVRTYSSPTPPRWWPTAPSTSVVTIA
ncbi:PQQ-binding-like beta-propeller repeat protein [Streptomyces sp. NPDC007901]|uniref:outer membrane protein assembly factor BamB family protein n=1 Tax=Streptomyces sp. NPDC007901 TaxID=3364785 RepID=UPI0036EA67A0